LTLISCDVLLHETVVPSVTLTLIYQTTLHYVPEESSILLAIACRFMLVRETVARVR
jgi:hypothetical protein